MNFRWLWWFWAKGQNTYNQISYLSINLNSNPSIFLELFISYCLVHIWRLLYISINSCFANVFPNIWNKILFIFPTKYLVQICKYKPYNEDENGRKDKVHASKAIFERHKCKLILYVAQVDLNNIHVSGIEDKENLREGIQFRNLLGQLAIHFSKDWYWHPLTNSWKYQLGSKFYKCRLSMCVSVK